MSKGFGSLYGIWFKNKNERLNCKGLGLNL
jgi:hypothetical protein